MPMTMKEPQRREKASAYAIHGLAMPWNAMTRPAFAGRNAPRGVYAKFEPGAFAKSLKQADRINLTLEHNPKRIVASTADGTLRIRETPRGLTFDAKPHDTKHGRDAVRGVVTERRDDCSVVVVSQDYRDFKIAGKNVRVIKRARLKEITLTDRPLAFGTAASCTRRYGKW